MNIVTSASNTTLRPPWLNVARAAWILLSAAAVIATVVSAVIAWGEPLPSCTTPDAVCGPWAVTQEDIAVAQQLGLSDQLIRFAYFAPTILARVCFVVVGLIIFWRKSDDWVALMLSLMLTLWTVEGIQNLGALMPVVNVLYMIDNAVFYVLPFIFPNGRFVPRWTRWIALLAIPLTLPIVFLPTLGIALDDRFYALALLGTSVPWFFVAGYAVIYRYRRVSNATERQQTKWVMAGMLGTFIVVIPFLGIATAFPPSQPSPERLAFVTLVLLPISALTYFAVSGGIAFAILRYRLYDVDIIIRRTLQYSVFTGVLALTYFGSIVVLQSIFTAVTGQSSAVIVVISTLAIAALFAPLRRRVQDVIDRRFFRKKYDAAKTLADFAATCRDETDLDTLTARLVEVVDETMQPESVALWLKPTEPTPSGKRIADQ